MSSVTFMQYIFFAMLATHRYKLETKSITSKAPVCDRQTSGIRCASSLNAPTLGAGPGEKIGKKINKVIKKLLKKTLKTQYRP